MTDLRASVEHLGGTSVRYTCPLGHSWSEDLGRKSLPRPKRLGAMAVQMLVSHWGKSGVRVPCPKCD